MCDGPLFKGKTVAVVGSGDPALDAATLLSNVVEKAHLIHTWDKPVGDKETLGNLMANSKVEFAPFTRVVEILGDKNVSGVLVEDTRNKQRKEIEVDGVFVEMGYVAKTDFIKDLVQLNDRKEIMIDKECTASHDGVFAAGDITDVPYKQAVISAGQGAIAALAAYNHVQRMRGGSPVRADWKVKKQS